MVERFQVYSKKEAEKHLKKFTHGNDFWEKTSSALLTHDYLLKQDKVELIMCKDFYEGVFIPKNDKIYLCGNFLMHQNEFNNALTRQLVILFDHHRG